MTELEEKLQVLIDTYGLEKFLDMNDIEKLKVMELIYEEGMVDLDDYFYEDIEDTEEGY